MSSMLMWYLAISNVNFTPDPHCTTVQAKAEPPQARVRFGAVGILHTPLQC